MRLSLSVFILFATVAVGQDCTESFQVSVIDQKTGGFVAGLNPGSLRANFGKIPLTLVALEPVRSRRILILFDESGSMSPTSDSSLTHRAVALRAIKQILTGAINELPPGVSVEYGLFNAKAVFGEGFFHEAGELQKSMDEVRSRFGKTGFGETALYDAVHEALLRFQAFQAGDTVLLVTDGEENHSKRFVKDLRNELQTAGVRLLTILLHWNESSFPVGSSVVEFRELVGNSGGSSLDVNTSSNSWSDKKTVNSNTQVVRAFWYGRVLSGYIARVQVPGSLRQPEKWTLSVNKDGSALQRELLPVYPSHINPCPVAAAQAR